MNCVWPKAPAQEPTNCLGSMSPASRIFKAEMNSPRKYPCLRPSQASVASDCTIGRLPEILAEIRFNAPDRRDDRFVDAIATFRDRQSMRPLLHLGAPVGDAFVIDEPREIIPDRRLEFGLRGLEAQKIGIRRKIARRDIDRRGGNAGASRRRLKASETVLKSGQGGTCRKQ